jgi:serine/threonine-protein kinase
MMALPSPTLLALQGALAGRYALERELGRGGMGVVYLARDLSLDRPVAIKLLPPSLAVVPALRERFLREARTSARLSHPHIVPIHSVEEHGDLALFVMGYVEGETLGQRIARDGSLSPDEAIRILQEVAWALAYAHQHGVVHRDVKPDNILLERATGRAMVSDFGIAQVEHSGSGLEPGEVAGTLRYMSPEQQAGGAVDGRSDLYSLGVTALQALQPDLPASLVPIIERCLEPDPAARFPDGEALAEALGAARGSQLVVPLAVERFVDLYKTLGVEVSTYAAILLVLAGETVALSSSSGFGVTLFGTILIYALFLAIGLGGLRMLQLVRGARGLLERGYSVGDVRRALDRPEQQRDLPVRLPPWGLAAAGVAGAGLWMVAWRWWDLVSRGPIVDGLLFAVLTLVPVVLLRSLFARMMRPGRKGWWSRAWWRVMEWKVFKVAWPGRGRGSVAASEPTEVMLGAGTQELFEALPGELRARLREVPTVVERLQLRARQLREAPAESGRARLATTLAAMERLRLDLLRLRAGTGSTGDLTRDLEAVRAVGEQIEALLNARSELDIPSTPPGV